MSMDAQLDGKRSDLGPCTTSPDYVCIQSNWVFDMKWTTWDLNGISLSLGKYRAGRDLATGAADLAQKHTFLKVYFCLNE